MGIAELLREHWDLWPDRVDPLPGGMNSRTWLVVADGTAYVAKQVEPHWVDGLAAGARTATDLAAAGIRTGPPLPTGAGGLLVRESGLVLLEHVAGRELDGDLAEDQGRMADTLARVHGAGAPGPGPGTRGFFTWLRPDAPGLPSWLAEAIVALRAETDDLELTWATLHTDPTPDAFRLDEADGETGLIDWAGSCRGPVLYDVASAVMYLGGPPHAARFLDRYAGVGPLTADELRHVAVLGRFRWAVQGAYFADRLARVDLTGVDGQEDNRQGLEDARRGLASLGGTGEVRGGSLDR